MNDKGSPATRHQGAPRAAREPSPRTPRVITTQGELRIELPFQVTLESLAYIGVVSQETWHVSPHDHEHFELCYVAEGRGWFALDDVMHHVEAGDLFLTKPQEVHHGAALGTTPFRLYYLGFHLGGLRSLEAAFYGLRLPRVVHDREGAIQGTYRNLFHELQAACPFRAEMVQGLYFQLLVATLRAYSASEAEEHVKTTLTPAVKRVLSALHARVGAHYEAGRLAELAHLSRSQLDREFKRQLGMTPVAYTRALCLERAKHLLGEPGASVSGVAEALGFSSIHTFSIFFKRYTAVAPQRYKQQIMTLQAKQ